jgi:hypothetical protein
MLVILVGRPLAKRLASRFDVNLIEDKYSANIIRMIVRVFDVLSGNSIKLNELIASYYFVSSNIHKSLEKEALHNANPWLKVQMYCSNSLYIFVFKFFFLRR